LFPLSDFRFSFKSPLFDPLFSKACFQKGTGARMVPIRSPSPDNLRPKFHQERVYCQRGRCELGQLALRSSINHQLKAINSLLPPCQAFPAVFVYFVWFAVEPLKFFCV
jgi:hypothetical protein